MICKKCGAYNPDHANFCKVCAANLKAQAESDEEVKAAPEEAADQEFRPQRGNLKTPDFITARRSMPSFQEAIKAAAPVAQKEEDDAEEFEEEEELEEEVKPAKKPAFARDAAPAKKRRVMDEDEDEEDDEEDDYEDEDEEEEAPKPARRPLFGRSAAPAKKRSVPDEDEDDDKDEDDEDDYDEDDDAEKLESEPKTSRFARPSLKKRPVDDEDDEDENEVDDDDEDIGYEDEEDEDDYEEYEPTPPRRKKSSQKKGGDSGFNIVTLLIVCLLAILLIIVGIVVVGNLKSSMRSKLPSFLQFNCAGKATTEKTQPQSQVNVPSQDTQITSPTDAPVTGTPVDYSATTLEEIVDDQGRPCINISMTARPGDTVTIVLPNQDDYVVKNEEDTDQPYLMTIFKSCYYPNKPLTDSIYTVTPEIIVTHADGTKDSLHVDSFDIVFPTVQLALKNPAKEDIGEDGIMAPEGNVFVISGTVDDHTVAVTVNGQPVTNMYTGGNFDFTYTLSGDEPETVTIEASKADYVPTSYSFVLKPYVFVPDPMVLTVETDVNKLKADKNQKVTVTGTTVPGATLTAYPAPQYQTSVVCGAPTVDAQGNYSFDVTFDKSYYGVASIIIHAKKDGFEEGETSCFVYRMYATKDAAVAGFRKTKDYHEVYKGVTFEDLMADPGQKGLYRFSGKIVSVDTETGVVTFEAITGAKAKTNIYVLNASDKWEPFGNVGKSYFLYVTLNGLYSDGTSLYVTAWFIKKN